MFGNLLESNSQKMYIWGWRFLIQKKVQKKTSREQSGAGQRRDLAVADHDHGVLCFESLRGVSGLLKTFRGVFLKIRQARGTNSLLFYP